MTYPSLFVDSFGRFSAIDLPELGTSKLGLRNPDRLVAIDGSPVDCPVDGWGTALRCVLRELERKRVQGAKAVVLVFDHGGTRISVARDLRTVGGNELVPLFLVYAVVGFLVLRTGGLVVRHAEPSAGTRAFAAWSLTCSLFFFTFFDYHTTGFLSPVFSMATVAVELSFLWLGYAFPTRPDSRALLYVMYALTGTGAIVASWIVFSPVILHHDPVIARTVVGFAALPCLGAMAITTFVRWLRADAAMRRVLRSAVIGIGVVPAVMGLGFALADLTGIDLVHAFLPLLGTLVPLSIGYALIRRNTLKIRTVLSRTLFELPVLVLSLGVGGVLWTQLRGVSGDIAAGLGSVMTWFVLTQLLAPRLFPARASFRPSIEALRDALSECRSVDDVSRSLEQIIERWISVTSVKVVPANDLAPALVADARLAISRGEVHVQDADGRLLVPLRVLDEMHAVAIIGSKRDEAPFNQEDVALVHTIAGFGALALQHARMLGEIEDLRRVELDAAGREKQATVALLGAEVAHEVAYSLSFLRFLLREGGNEVTEGDVEVGRDEIARLERMLGAMRRLAPPPPEILPTSVFGPIVQATTLLREQFAQMSIDLDVEHTDLVAMVDRDELVQVMANLFRNAIQAAGQGGKVLARCDETEARVRIRVLDDGPGVSPELDARLFTPWASGRPGGTGLGLAVAARIVRGWGGTLTYERVDEMTEFNVTVPKGRA
jgi:nitrogen-specific signal transduction histidine kinase